MTQSQMFDDWSISRNMMPDLPPIETLAARTTEVLRRVGIDPDEMASMIDTFASLIGSTGPSLPLPEPVYAVAPTEDDRWSVVCLDRGQPRSIDTLASKRDAVAAGRQHARAADGTLVVHRHDGSVLSTYLYGNHTELDAELEVDEGPNLVSLDAYRS